MLKRIAIKIFNFIFGLVIVALIFVSSMAGSASAALEQYEKKEPPAMLSEKKITLPQRNIFTLSLKNAKQHVSWSTSNPRIARIESLTSSIPQKANIEGGDEGSTTVTARSGTETYTCHVKVTRAELMPVTIDPLKNMKLTYTGKSGKAYVSWKDRTSYDIQYPEIRKFMKTVYIEPNKGSNLSNGDKIKFRLYYDKELAKEAQMVVARTKRTVTVKGLNTVPDHDQSSKEKLMKIRPDADSVWLSKKSAAAVVLEKNGYAVYTGRYWIGAKQIDWDKSMEGMSVSEAENYLREKGYDIL